MFFLLIFIFIFLPGSISAGLSVLLHSHLSSKNESVDQLSFLSKVAFTTFIGALVISGLMVLTTLVLLYLMLGEDAALKFSTFFGSLGAIASLLVALFTTLTCAVGLKTELTTATLTVASSVSGGVGAVIAVFLTLYLSTHPSPGSI